MTDAELDRTLDAALGVDPSPEFLARVRNRVATEPTRTPWLGTWRHVDAWGMAGLGAAAGTALVVATLVWPRPPDLPPAVGGQSAGTAPPVPVEAVTPPAKPGQGLNSPEQGMRPRPAVAAARPSAQAAVNAEVVVAPAEAAALRTLFANVSQGHVAPSWLPDLAAPSGPLEPIDAIDVAPIAVNPLRPIEAEAGVL
jgi:hypothetical protein